MPEKTIGQINNSITANIVLKNTVIIGTNRLPLKNDKAIGNSTSLNLLKEYAAINPIIYQEIH